MYKCQKQQVCLANIEKPISSSSTKKYIVLFLFLSYKQMLNVQYKYLVLLYKGIQKLGTLWNKISIRTWEQYTS